MPVALFVCPHCEKHAEVQVTSVTRSRPCPHCGEHVVLQVSAKDKGKRRALLVAGAGQPPVVAAPDKTVPGPAYEPVSLEGDVLERMKFDPEVRAFRKRLIIGVSAVAAIIVGSIIWHMVGDSVSQSVASIASKPVEEPKVEPAHVDPQALPANAIGMRRGSPTQAPSTTKFVFEAPPTPEPTAFVPPLPTVPAVSQPVANATPAPAAGIEARENGGDGTKKVTLAMTDPRVQAAAALERFLLANNIDAMLATVADRPKMEPKIRSYLEKHPLVPIAYESLTISNGAGPTGERSIVVTLKDGTTREAVVVREDDRSVVDWPSFVAWSDMEWAQFMEKKPAEPVLFRVLATVGERYDNAFADSKALRCVKLIDPRSQSTAPIFAYVESTSPMGQKVDAFLNQAEGKPTKLTLHLKYPTDAKSQDQVWIDSVVANGWMLPRDKSTASN